jgi:hypothetical protein
MTDLITFRPTAEDTENLAILTADGTSPTQAIRRALEIAANRNRQEDLRADAARLAANPEYQAEIRAVREELE